MITFRKGPADGQTLRLRRAPVCLRVVRDARGTFDALDQSGDSPRTGEVVWVYVLASWPTHYHICDRGRGGKSLSGWWPEAEYRYFPDQPGEAVLLDNDRWCSWCEANREKLTEFFNAGVLEIRRNGGGA